MKACGTCGSTGDWRCIRCPPPDAPAPRVHRASLERKAAQKKAQHKRWYEKNRAAILEQKRREYQAIKHLRPEPEGDGPTTLYRFFATDGALLYVGITKRFEIRLSQHRRHSDWFESVHRWTLEEYPTRRRAKVVETQAIREERPRFNKHESMH